MADFTHTDLQLVGRHVPDPIAGPFDNAQQAQAAGYDTMNPVTGTYEIGVLIEGAFVPLISEKASLIFDRIEVAQQAQADQAAQQPQPADQPQTGPQSDQAASPPADAQPADQTQPQFDQPQA